MYFLVKNKNYLICLINFNLFNYDFLKGLLLVPNGEDIGYYFGDFYPYKNFTNITTDELRDLPHRTTSYDTNETASVENNSHPWGVFFTILGTVN